METYAVPDAPESTVERRFSGRDLRTCFQNVWRLSELAVGRVDRVCFSLKHSAAAGGRGNRRQPRG